MDGNQGVIPVNVENALSAWQKEHKSLRAQLLPVPGVSEDAVFDSLSFHAHRKWVQGC